jgi:putative ABC transport system substrate-binding protein
VTTRREFITLLGGAAAAWPLEAGSQQSAMPVVGVIGIGSSESNAKQLASFRKGLSEQGFVEGQLIESRFAATGQYDGLLSLASDLARLPVTVLVAIGTAGVARAAKHDPGRNLFECLQPLSTH